jgi:beta-lactamase class A
MGNPHRHFCSAVLAGAAGMLLLSGCGSINDLAAQLAEPMSAGANSVVAGEVAPPAAAGMSSSARHATSAPEARPTADAMAGTDTATLSSSSSSSTEAAPAPTPPPAAAPNPEPSPTPQPVAADAFSALTTDLAALAAATGRHVGITLVDTTGAAAEHWSLHGADSFTAASTYKLPVLMWNAEGVATGRLHDTDSICYQDGDWEDGWFGDYTGGACYTRLELATRVGQHSDNTAAHMLVRDMGGGDVLNAYARRAGAINSVLWAPNTTTPDDLAALWAAEERGDLGGAAALQWLTPLLSHNETNGILEGLPPTTTALAKWGWIDSTENDAALVLSAKDGPYVLVVMTSGDGSDQGWGLLSSLSARVWQYESQRP